MMGDLQQIIKQTLVALDCPSDITDLLTDDVLIKDDDARLVKKIADLKTNYEIIKALFVPAAAAGAASGGRLSQKGGKNTPRKQNKKKNNSTNGVSQTRSRRTAVKIKSEERDYNAIYDTLMAIPQEEIPFKLSVKEYAAMVLYRLIVADVLVKNIKEENNSPTIVIGDDITTALKGDATIENFNEEPVILASGDNEDAANASSTEDIQVGGEFKNPLSDDINNYVQMLYSNTIEPFLRNHIIGIKPLHDSTIQSVLAGSYVQDVLNVFEEVLSLPDASNITTDETEQKEYNDLIAAAKDYYTSILTKIKDSESESEEYILQIKARHTSGMTIETVENFDKVFITDFYNEDKEQFSRSFFDKLQQILHFIEVSFELKKNDKKEKDTLSQGDFYTEINNKDSLLNIDDFAENKDFFQANLKYVIQDSMNDYFSIDAAAPPAAAAAPPAAAAAAAARAPEGGSRKFTRRIRTHRSKKSRKNKNK
jgi:ribosomal protein L12E/L44/L45/RPP1/RPP2